MSDVKPSAPTKVGPRALPIGTPAELVDQNLDPDKVPSCSKPLRGVRVGCSHYERCVFRFTKNGGFRDKGPRNVGYFLETHEGIKRERYCACFFYMDRLYDRQLGGEWAKHNGKKGETLSIIAQEGDVIHDIVTINENDGTNLPASWKKENKTVKIPPYPRPGQIVDIDYDTTVGDRQKLRDLQDEALREGLPRVDSAEPDRVMDVTATAEPESA